MTTKIYVEGGGHGDALRTACRKAFKTLFTKAGIERLPRVIPSGGRKQAYDDFCTALQNATKDERVLLLVDSEGTVSAPAWDHLSLHDRWDKPAGAADNQAHLMIQCMETWFLADKELLEKFFGQGFLHNALPRNPQLEDIPKSDVLDGLSSATHGCGREREYRKGKRSFDLLGQLDTAKVIAQCPSARRLFDALT